MDSTSTLFSRWVKRSLTVGLLAASVAGCSAYQSKPPAPPPKYQNHPGDPNLPVYMKGTIRDLTILGNIGNFPVTNWGLVVGLRGTGDSTCPSLVRDYMLKEMRVRGVGSPTGDYGHIQPEQMLNDSRVAVVGVLANIPAGARKGDYVDTIVQVMPGNNTTSLANGVLYRTDLKINGMADPVGQVNPYAKCQGSLFVNPVYAVKSADSTAPRTSLRTAIIPNGTIVMTDRPMHLILRTPSWSTSRAIEYCVNQRFRAEESAPDNIFAAAQDEGYVHLMLPHRFHGDWQHFAGIVTHLYLNSDPAFSILKAKQLVEEAKKPGAALEDISYCWEGFGPSVISIITPLMSNPQPDIQFAAARAAAFLGDSYGADRLAQIAGIAGHPFQINAIRALGQLPSSGVIDAELTKLLDSDQTLARTEAYEVLVEHGCAQIYSKPIQSRRNSQDEFMLDLVNCGGPPLVYCSRVGRPRVAIFGQSVSLQTPVVFSAFDARLTIANLPNQPRVVNLYYHDGNRTPIQAQSGLGLGEVVARLGGATDDGFRFTYGDIVAILQSMSTQRSMVASFVLQQMPEMANQIESAPSLPEGRPQTDAVTAPPRVDASLPDLRPVGPTLTTQPVNGKPQGRPQ